jgi:cysteine desulfurase
MLANNESGALQPVREVSDHCRKNKILFHTDAAQAAGKVSVRLSDLGDPDMVTLVGHKIGAPKGIACMCVRVQSTILRQRGC